MNFQQARDSLIESLSKSRGRPVTPAEALTMLGPKGRRVVETAERIDQVQRKAAKKAAKRAARESLRSAVSRQILESLTASQAPVAPAAAVPAPQAGGDDVLAIGEGMRSPFWRSPGAVAETAPAPEPSKPLHEMDVEEFRAHASETFGAYGRAVGHHSPIWQ